MWRGGRLVEVMLQIMNVVKSEICLIDGREVNWYPSTKLVMWNKQEITGGYAV